MMCLFVETMMMIMTDVWVNDDEDDGETKKNRTTQKKTKW